jgi:hypothetical protein
MGIQQESSGSEERQKGEKIRDGNLRNEGKEIERSQHSRTQRVVDSLDEILQMTSQCVRLNM